MQCAIKSKIKMISISFLCQFIVRLSVTAADLLQTFTAPKDIHGDSLTHTHTRTQRLSILEAQVVIFLPIPFHILKRKRKKNTTGSAYRLMSPWMERAVGV